MTTPTPGILVEAAATLAPPRFGLVSAATVVANTDDHARGGIDYLPNVTGQVGYLTYDCNARDEASIPEPSTGLGYVSAPPITLYAAFECKAPGLTSDIVQARVRDRVINGESAALEAALWHGTVVYGDGETGDTVGFMGSDTVDLTGNRDAVSFADGIGALERFMWDHYGGTPAIHVPRQHYPILSAARLLDTAGGKATTPVGSSLVLGSYPNSGPDMMAAADGETWLVATGQLILDRFDLNVTGHEFQADGAGFSARDNMVYVEAHRTEIVRWDGLSAAIRVTI